MKSICLFSSYFNEPKTPYYIEFYLENLLPYFSEIVFITNEKILNEMSTTFLKERKINLMYVSNEGWDFGMWYKAIKTIDTKSYERIGLVNDSCILFKKPVAFFDWLEKSNLDYCGMVDSNSIAYHIQSYFTIINKNAITHVLDYFNSQGIIKDVKQVIQKYEVGLSQYLIQKGLKVDALYSTKEITSEFSPTFYVPVHLINKGFPLIKKKIIFCSYRKDEYMTLMRMNFIVNPNYYTNIISEKYKNDNGLINFKKVIENKRDFKFYFQIFKYNIFSFFFQIIRQFKFLRK